MIKRILSIASLVVLFAAAAVADNPPEPGVTGQGDTSSPCSECSTDHVYAYCDSDAGFDAQRWADCQGGQICYWSGSVWVCEPDCGGRRCYLV